MLDLAGFQHQQARNAGSQVGRISRRRVAGSPIAHMASRHSVLATRTGGRTIVAWLGGTAPRAARLRCAGSRTMRRVGIALPVG